MSRQQIVGIIGAGTMGSGIAQIAAAAGYQVLVYDATPGAAQRAVDLARERLVELKGKGRLQVDTDALSLEVTASINDFASVQFVIEAVTEDLEVKIELFTDLEKVVTADCILATNTSSLSPTAIASSLQYPGRLVGLHFFNPVPLMRLVEVVPGLATDPRVVDSVVELAVAWGKTVVRATATPGFIVNRIARPFYAEAWRLHEEQAADVATIDAVLTRAGGFRMGPFALMDLIGHDVNEAVTRSIWKAFGYDPRFAPALAQRELVEAGWLGRKTARGCYDYADGAKPTVAIAAASHAAPLEIVEHGESGLRGLLRRSGVPVLEGDRDAGLVELPSSALLARSTGLTATEMSFSAGRPVILVDRTLDDEVATAVAIAASTGCPESALGEAIGLLQRAGLDVFVIDDVAGLIVTRTVAMIVNIAADALQRGVATEADIDTAMQLGTNYPVGPLEWGRRWGARVVLDVLDALYRTEGDPRYRASTLLRQRALSDGSVA